MKHYHRIKNFSIGICIISFLAVVSFSVFGYFFGFQTKGILAQTASCDLLEKPKASVTTDATTAHVTLVPVQTTDYDYTIYTSDGQIEDGTLSASNILNGIGQTVDITTDTTSGTNELKVFVSSTDNSCTNNLIYDQDLTYNGGIGTASYTGVTLNNDVKYDSSGSKVSFTVSNPNIIAIYAGITITDSNGNPYTKAGQTIAANANGSFNISITDTTNPTVPRTIEVDSYMSPTDSNPFASTSGSFNISTGTGTVNNDISSNPDNGPITVPKSASKISSTDDLIAAILTLLEYLIGVLAVIGLIIGGIQYITASGDQAKAEKAKKTLLYSIIGITIAVLSLVLTDAIACALTSGQLSLTCSGSGSYNWDLKTLLQTSSSTCPAAANSTTLGLCNIEAIVEKIAQWALDFAGVAAFIMIMYSSVVYLTSYGEESKAETAKKTLMWSVIGMAVVVFSKVLVLGIIGYFK